jgi:hypothetical protein
MQTAHEMLEQYPSTKKLRELGFTDEHLKSVRFNPKYRFHPIQDRPLTWHHSILVEDHPEVLSIMREYATLRFALVDGHTEGGRSISDAFLDVSLTLAAPMVEARLKYLFTQKINAQKKRGLIPEIKMSVGQLAMQYARKPENLALTPRQMWPGFYGEMSFGRLDPVRRGNSYLYLDDRSISFRTFAKYVREARNEDKATASAAKG